MHRGEFRDAAALEDDFLPRAREIGDPQVLVPALTTGALSAQARGELAAAMQLLEELDRATPAGAPDRPVRLPDALRVCVAAKAIGLGERLIEAVTETTPRAAYALVTARAVLAKAHGELERAAEQYASAAERWSEFGFALEHGHALLGGGRCLLGLSRAREAARKLGDARETFARLGARPLVNEAEAFVKARRLVSDWPRDPK